MDRQILGVLLEPIKHDLGASDAARGLLTGFAFISFYTLASIPLARWADARSRRNLIAGALAFWSAMTTLSGAVTSFVQLALARVGVGIGAAATGPANQSMLSDLFERERRTVALSILGVGVPAGLIAASIGGGWLNDAIGWRGTLVAIAIPGLLLALLLIGVGLGPVTVGVLSDLLAPVTGIESIRYALLLAAGLATLGAVVLFAIAARHLRGDIRLPVVCVRAILQIRVNARRRESRPSRCTRSRCSRH